MTTHLKGFGLENFRVFKDYTWFDFAPITILTGVNSSGKSSLIKALLLLENSVSKAGGLRLQFSNDNVYQLGNFERILNNKSSENTIKFRFPYKIKHFPTLGDSHECQVEMTYTKPENAILAESAEYSILIDNKPILTYGNNKLHFDLACFLQKVYLNTEDFKINKLEKERITFFGIKRSGLYILAKKDLNPLDKHFDIRYADEGYIEVFGEKDSKEDIEDVLAFYKKTTLLKNGSPDTEIEIEIYSTYYNPELEEEVESWDVHEDENPLRTILRTYGLSDNLIKFIDLEVLGFNNRFLKGEWLNDLETIQYQSAVRGQVNRIYRKEEKGVLNDLISAFFDNEAPEISIDFLQKWADKFDLQGEIKPFLDSKYNIQSIEIGDSPLVEQGLGIAQLVALLLTIITQKDNKKVFIFEEPEANLHPKFQSLLADMFIDAAKTFNVQFIIETHSEYLIRKMQYLTAKKEVAPTDTALYYFHDPNNVPAGESQVKKIEILEDGSLSSDFGTGFFDEAVNLELELLRLKNNKNRQN